MKSVFKPLLIAGILTTVGVSAFSQAPGMGPGAGMGPGGAMMGAGGPMHQGMGHPGMGRMDPAKMQARVEKHQAVLKAMLKLTPAQEGAWTSFTAALKPPTERMAMQRPDPTEIAKLTTPERIDKMKSLHTQHQTEMNAAMDKRADATKAFYTALTPEQQKVFDAATVRYMARGGHMGGPRDGRGPA
jgi:Spy/CpxP family protein refolding chaperone